MGGCGQSRSAARLNYYTYRRSPQFGLRLGADSIGDAAN